MDLNQVESVNPQENQETVLGESQIDNLIAQSQESEEAGRGFMQPKDATPKRKRGRPRKEAEAASEPGPAVTPTVEPALDFSEPCKLTFGALSECLAAYCGDKRMLLTDKEVDGLGNAWGKVCNRYVPAYMAQHGELIAALMVTVPTVTRLKFTADQILAEKKAKMDAERAAFQNAESVGQA